jgi:hypothetical protein
LRYEVVVATTIYLVANEHISQPPSQWMILADSGVVSLIVWYWYAARTATFSYVHILFLCVAVLGVEILVSWVFDSSCFLFMASIDKFQLFDGTCFLLCCGIELKCEERYSKMGYAMGRENRFMGLNRLNT